MILSYYWVLETEPGATAKVLSALYYWDISLIPITSIFIIVLLDYSIYLITLRSLSIYTKINDLLKFIYPVNNGTEIRN